MPLLERKTASRGRSAVPATLPRIRLRRLRRLCSFVCFMTLNSRVVYAPAPKLLPTVVALPARHTGFAGAPFPCAALWGEPAPPMSCPLSDLAKDDLALVADALALVGLRRAQLADVRGDLPDGLLVDAAHDHLGRGGHLEADALGRIHGDGVRVAERE